MGFHLQTRGRTKDYCFLGTPPSSRWWTNFRDITSFERPTILVSADDSGWRAYISGIPSKRLDRVHTPIRYTIVSAGCLTDNSSFQGTLNLISAWIEDIAEPNKPSYLQSKLDEKFGEIDVERLINSEDKNASTIEVNDCITNVLSQLNIFKIKAEHDSSCIGPVQMRSARDKFIGKVSALLQGGNGHAFFVNLIGTVEEARNFADRYDNSWILINDLENRLGGKVVDLKKKTDKAGICPKTANSSAVSEEVAKKPAAFSNNSSNGDSYINADSVKIVTDNNLPMAVERSQNYGDSKISSFVVKLTGCWCDIDSDMHQDIDIYVEGQWSKFNFLKNKSELEIHGKICKRNDNEIINIKGKITACMCMSGLKIKMNAKSCAYRDDLSFLLDHDYKYKSLIEEEICVIVDVKNGKVLIGKINFCLSWMQRSDLLPVVSWLKNKFKSNEGIC